jgi:hypothetical protein
MRDVLRCGLDANASRLHLGLSWILSLVKTTAAGQTVSKPAAFRTACHSSGALEIFLLSISSF